MTRFTDLLCACANEAPRHLPPLEEHWEICSPLQTVPYPVGVACKQRAVAALLGREVRVAPSAVVWGYRKKMEFALYGDESGVRLAWHARKSRGRRKVPIEGCALASPALNAVARQAAALVGEVGARAGDAKALVVSESKATGDLAVRLVVHGGREDHWQRWQERAAALPGVAVAQVGFARRESPATTPERIIAGPQEAWLSERVCGVMVRYPAFGFFQNNVWQLESALIVLAEWLSREAPRRFALWDAYAGAAPLSAALARMLGARVTGVRAWELDADLSRAARENLAQSGVPFEVVEGDVARTLRLVGSEAAEREEAVLIVDPPRAGLHPKLAARLREAGPPVLAYLSCNPETFARDRVALRGAYTLVALEGFDFYPHTLHLEVLALFVRQVAPASRT